MDRDFWEWIVVLVVVLCAVHLMTACVGTSHREGFTQVHYDWGRN